MSSSATTGRHGWREALAAAPTEARILIVDDDVRIRRSLQRMISRWGYTAEGAGSAEEADVLLGDGRFDACLLDMQLPRMSGLEFLTRALDRDPEMAVLMMTGVDDPDVAIECLNHGARTYVVKPVEIDFLELALRDALAMRTVLVERNDFSETLRGRL